ncbi:hypothetical protein NMG60_11018326 [Bertholletia excelsa]
MLHIKQEDKFFSRLLSRETSRTDSSFRVLYYGGAPGAVPFRWESRPGTPKHPCSSDSLPPLTPPPSYQFNNHKSNKSMQKSASRPNLLSSIFPGKRHVAPSLSSSSASSSRSSGTFSSGSVPGRRRAGARQCGCWPRRRSAMEFGGDDNDEGIGGKASAGSPIPVRCFGVDTGFAVVRAK